MVRKDAGGAYVFGDRIRQALHAKEHETFMDGPADPTIGHAFLDDGSVEAREILAGGLHHARTRAHAGHDQTLPAPAQVVEPVVPVFISATADLPCLVDTVPDLHDLEQKAVVVGIDERRHAEQAVDAQGVEKPVRSGQALGDRQTSPGP